jgi:hypothetical protein
MRSFETMTRWIVGLLTVAALASAAQAQVWLWQKGGGSGIVSGGGGPPPSGCTNMLVLDYSNSCALIGRPYGE